ncbi:hypothetical protein LGT39_05385 [Demequina sp. TTPB684]|uniref:hypothetical protein n=1 Tax=unclassified Demequina TaxID=2620311 RepID=UPI001CF33AA1|nr:MULTISPECIES: hypothetical protein [unclassified Demequina]MCB2412280.1 hypothetical protein [Demequina sp. TTPB684]UPU88479.1 hypothetical protein LGT36_000710 [Demequina sp. TMPB413]
MSDPHLTPRRVALGALVAVWVLVALAFFASPGVAVLALAAFAFAGAVARVRTPLRRSFMVRRRAIDVIVLAAFGVALAYLGLTANLG